MAKLSLSTSTFFASSLSLSSSSSSSSSSSLPSIISISTTRRNRSSMAGLSVRASSSSATPLMVNDCTGKMGRAVAEAALEAGLQLVPFCLTGPGRGGRYVEIGNVKIDVRETSEKEGVLDHVLDRYPGLIIVDYTLPDAVNENADFYCRRGVPFVMGTTGGDREKLIEHVNSSGVYAVIAPQMGKQVVAFQAAMEIMAEQFPGAFSGYTLKVVESHQSAKVDTSGTARAVIATFRKLGLAFRDDQIEMVRDPKEQINTVGVPEEYLNGHAFHTYSLTSPDGTVSFEFQHNVCGRSIYAQGTVDAVLFLAKKVQENSGKKLYNMIDVLRGGSMR